MSSPIPVEQKREAMKQLASGISAAQIARNFNVSDSTIYNWRDFGVEPGSHTTKAAKTRKRKPNVSVKQIRAKAKSLREELFNEVAEEYKETEAKLKDLHAKLTFLGEEWK